MFSISVAIPEDYPRIIELGKEFRLTPYVVDPIFTTMTDIITPMLLSHQMLSNSSFKVLVAKLKGTVIGFIIYSYDDGLSNYLKLQDLEAPRCGSIIFLAVDPIYRRNNVASALINMCKKNCAKDGVGLLRVNTDYGNEPALNLYQKYGFKVNMNFHIYRIYKHQLTFKLSTQASKRLFLPASIFAEPLEEIVKRRPVPWYYTPLIKKIGVESYILYQLKEQLKTNHISIIQKNLYNKTVGLILKQEKEKEIYYGLNGSVWTITDIMEDGIRGEQLPFFIQYVLYSLPNFLMADILVNAADYETQKILRESNMNYIYGGISLSAIN
ncbi:MAG: GNAT family N-acetyltransferase [Brevinema sp.]